MGVTFVPFYPSDWLGGTGRLSDGERGVYITLVAQMYEDGGPIERNDARLARLCGCRNIATFRRHLESLIDLGKIIEDDGFLFNEKAEKVLSSVSKRSSKARESANRRWGKKSNKNNGSDDAAASPEHMRSGCYTKTKAKDNTPTPTVPPSDCARATTDPPAEQPQQDKPASQQKATPAVEPDDDQLLADVMKAVGLDGHEGHHYWLPPTSTIHVGKWRRDLGLTYHQILAAAKESRKRHTEPPRGPKALDGVMKAMASVIHAPPMTPAANAPPKPGKWRNIAAQFEAQDPTRRAAT